MHTSKKKVFWKGVIDFSMNEAEVGEVLEKMVVLTGNHSDVDHWRNLVRQTSNTLNLCLNNGGSQRTRKLLHGSKKRHAHDHSLLGDALQILPEEYAERMIHTWA